MEMEDPGFSFRPTVPELIKVMKFKARGGGDISEVTESPGDISERDLYGEGKEPWKVLCGSDVKWNLFQAGDKKKKKKFATYVVTKVSKLGENKTVRRAGRGCWDGQTSETSFKKDGEYIAYMKQLSYVYHDSGDGRSEAAGQLYYYLHEYRLSEEYLEKIGAVGTTYVLCRIVVDTTQACRVELVKPSARRRNSRTRVDSSPTTQQEQHHHQDSRQPIGIHDNTNDPAMLTIEDYGFPTQSHEDQGQVSRQQMVIQDSTDKNPVMLTDEDYGFLTWPTESQDQDEDYGFPFPTCSVLSENPDTEGSSAINRMVDFDSASGSGEDLEFDKIIAEFLEL